MARPEYPLEALRKLRDDQADEQARALGVQIARSKAAETELEQRTATRRAHAERTSQCLRLERDRLAAGQVSGAELLRAAEFEAAARAQAALLERAEAEARQILSEARAQEQKLRAELQRKEADAQLVRNHETSFEQRALDQQQRADEEAALEQWNARRR